MSVVRRLVAPLSIRSCWSSSPSPANLETWLSPDNHDGIDHFVEFVVLDPGVAVTMNVKTKCRGWN